MSSLGRKARELVELYRGSLEQRIEQGDWNLVCRDETLCEKVERLLMNGCAQDVHVFPSVDPLEVMKQSLQRAAHFPDQASTAAGLEGLARAFEVLELAALNLHLCPWRKEYRVVKMFSGMFSHYIKPSLSTPQVLELFGLLGYQASKARSSEELCLCPQARPLDFLLHLACAFFTARCECRMLLAALEKKAGAGARNGGREWELNLVQERQRGHSLEQALDNTKRKFDWPSLRDDILESSAIENQLDLYTAEGAELNRGQGEAGLAEEGLHSPPLVVCSSSKLTTAVNDSNGVSTSRETVCVSTLNCQLTKSTKPKESSGKEQARQTSNRMESLPSSLSSQTRSRSSTLPDDTCSCTKSKHVFQQHCYTCNGQDRHDRGPAFEPAVQEYRESRGAATGRGGGGEGWGSASPPSQLHDAQGQLSCLSADYSGGSPAGSFPAQPIPFHECCDTTKPEPQLVCKSCRVFHISSCGNVEFCQVNHVICKLGVCSKRCKDPPYILCRYCGAEYCKRCWYLRPLECHCGQTFDQSSSV